MLELKLKKGELPAKYARRARRIADHIDPKHDNLMAIKFRDGFRSRSLKRHISIWNATGKNSFELIYKQFTDIDRFEQKKQRKKNRLDPFGSGIGLILRLGIGLGYGLHSQEKEEKEGSVIQLRIRRFILRERTCQEEKMKKQAQSTRKDPIRESIDELKKTVDLLKSSFEAAAASLPGRTGRKLTFFLSSLEASTPMEPEDPFKRSIDELKNLLTSRRTLDCKEPMKELCSPPCRTHMKRRSTPLDPPDSTRHRSTSRSSTIGIYHS